MRLPTMALAALAAILLPTPGRAQDQDAPDFDSVFVCPEALDSVQSPARPSQAFLRAMARLHPNMSEPDLRLGWRATLERHRCAKSLERLQATEDSIRGGAVMEQSWLPLGGNGEVSLWVSEDYLKAFADPRYPGEHAVEAYVRALFSSQRRMDLTQQPYDEVVSHVVYYCASGQRALVENDFFLAGKTVLKEPRAPETTTADGLDLYTPTPLAQGSLNLVAGAWTCGAARALQDMVPSP